jgi:hypothetical protein
VEAGGGHIRKVGVNGGIKHYFRVVEPEPQGAGTFCRSRSWNRNIEVSAPASGSGSGSAKVLIFFLNRINNGLACELGWYSFFHKSMKNPLFNMKSVIKVVKKLLLEPESIEKVSNPRHCIIYQAPSLNETKLRNIYMCVP